MYSRGELGGQGFLRRHLIGPVATSDGRSMDDVTFLSSWLIAGCAVVIMTVMGYVACSRFLRVAG